MSLRNRLLLILGGTFIVLWSLAALWLLGDLRREVNVALDERLASSARMVAGLLEQLPQPLLSSPNPLTAMELGLESGLVCQVRSLRGEVLVRTPNMPNQNMLEKGAMPSIFTGLRTYKLARTNISVVSPGRAEMW